MTKRPAPRILDLVRDMLDHRHQAAVHTETGQHAAARHAADEYAISWEHIVRRLRTALAAR